LLERYCGYLNLRQNTGDVMAESRGKKEDMALKSVYEGVWERGTRYLTAQIAQGTLTSRRIKLKPKASNIAGLQLADILAHPLTRDVLAAFGKIDQPVDCFAQKLVKIAERKYNRHEYRWREPIQGYGRVLLD
jgi:hypothetical protein